MSFITARRAINAAAGIAEGQKAKNAVKDAQGNAIANPDLATFKVAYQALCTVSQQLEDYYKAHPVLGFIVKIFDNHSIFGLFGKKSKIDALIRELKIFEGQKPKREVLHFKIEKPQEPKREVPPAKVEKRQEPKKGDEDADLKAAVEASLRDQEAKKPQVPGMDPRLAMRLAEQASKVTYAEEQKTSN